MFTQFLHPELVLFGEFSNDKIKCKHNYELKDGEIIVHQVINRGALLSKSLLDNFMKLFHEKAQHRQQEGDDDWQDEQNRPYRRDYHEDDEYPYEDDEQENEQMRGYEGYFEEDGNPYADQVYGLNMQAQYMPEQLNGLYQPQKSIKQHSEDIPFRAKPKKDEKKQQQEEDEQGWITEEQQQYYVNEQLQQAGGSFATEFVPDSIIQ